MVIYLDYAASAPMWPAVRDAMTAAPEGNAGSVHSMGEVARGALDTARRELAKEVGARAEEIVFTSGATESNNLVLFGVARNDLLLKEKRKRDKRRSAKKRSLGKIVVSAVEHASVWEPAQSLKEEGFTVEVADVDKGGQVDMSALRQLVDNRTVLVSVQHANNEFGSLQRIQEIGALCKERGVLFHVDAAQTFGKLKIDVRRMGIDLLSASAHKIGGPKGVGFLFVRKGVELASQIKGGGQERGLRSGTEYVAGAVGFAAALLEQRQVQIKKVLRLRDFLIEGLMKSGGLLLGSRRERLWNNALIRFPGQSGEDLMMRLSEKGIMCGTGSACSSKKEDGRVLKALGFSQKEVREVVRFSLGSENTKEEIEHVLETLRNILRA